MANIVKIFMDALNPRKMYLWMFLLLIMLVAGGLYIYKHNYTDLIIGNKHKNIPNSGSGDDIQILFFTVDWCPHCKKAATPWNDFSASHNNKQINNVNVQCIKYDITEKEKTDPGYNDYKNSLAMVDMYKVEGYPTIKMLKDGQVIDFDAKITSYSLERFVENMT
jgi:thiol-disulfide isomerase/thioredoxin